MSSIHAKNVIVDFPIYGSTGNRSFKKVMMNAATGGVFAQDAGERVVVRALDKISFDFREGDRVGLIGHNGSGKSTLLRVLAGIYEPVEGELVINGRVTSLLSLTLGMDNEASGMENIYMRGHVMGLRTKQISRVIDDIAEFSGIGNYLHLPMRTYSSGMSMRLAFAVSTCIDAEIILMDEWLSVGDAEFVGKAQARMNGLVKNARIVIIASHDHKLIKKECNKIIKLEHGKIISFEEKELI
jgi:lipopolysaccharide transport system ATP-binding protein